MIKKLLVLVTVFSMFNCITFSNPVNASETNGNDEIYHIMTIPDDVITDDMIQTGEDYASEMNRSNSMLRMDEEVWTLKSSAVAIPYGPIKASFGNIIPSGQSEEKTCSWSISAGTKVRGYELSVSVNGSKSITSSGPSSSDKLADGKSATHRAFFSVGYGTLMKYVYNITSKYSGNTLRTETRYIYTKVSTVSCTQLICLSGSTVYAENSNRTKVRNAGSLANYKSSFSSIDGTCLKNYNF